MADDPYSPAASQHVMRTVYHRHSPRNRAAVSMYTVDAAQAVNRHPDEWSYEPWGEEQPHANAGIVIPPEWRDLSTPRRRALAMHLGAPPTVKGAEADDIIQAEMERRDALMASNAEAADADEEKEGRVDERGQRQVAGPPIPNEWSDLGPEKRIELARSLGAPDDIDEAAADDFILNEEVRRTGLPTDTRGKRSGQ